LLYCITETIQVTENCLLVSPAVGHEPRETSAHRKYAASG